MEKSKKIDIFFADLPPIEKFSSRKIWESAVWKLLLSRLGKSALTTLSLLTSDDERHMIIYRAAVISRLQAGIGTSAISKELFLSRQTISAIKKGLLDGSYRSSHARGHKKKKYTDIPIGEGKSHQLYRRTKYGRLIKH